MSLSTLPICLTSRHHCVLSSEKPGGNKFLLFSFAATTRSCCRWTLAYPQAQNMKSRSSSSCSSSSRCRMTVNAVSEMFKHRQTRCLTSVESFWTVDLFSSSSLSSHRYFVLYCSQHGAQSRVLIGQQLRWFVKLCHLGQTQTKLGV